MDLNARQRSLIIFWLTVTVLAELVLLAGNRYLPQLYLLVAILFACGFVLRLADRYPGRPEPLALDAAAVVIALLFAAFGVLLTGHNLRFLLIVMSSLIILPHLFYIIVNPQRFPAEALMRRITVIKGDITRLKADAIVNAAHTALRGGGGVDAAIHRAAGPKLLAECVTLGGCETGQAKITRGYELPAAYVIHAPGPRWRGGCHQEDALLASCYRNALKVAVEHGVQSIAFPSISTGTYGFPVTRACRIALQTVVSFLQEQSAMDRVIFVCFHDDVFREYLAAGRELGLFREGSLSADAAAGTAMFPARG